MAGYTKEFLVNAFLSKFDYYKVDSTKTRALAEKHYDEVVKDMFRISTALDAAAIKEYKATGYCNL